MPRRYRRAVVQELRDPRARRIHDQPRLHRLFAASLVPQGRDPLGPGAFEGQIALVNQHEGGPETASDPAAIVYDVAEPELFAVSPNAASLGQYVDFEGGGFIGGDAEIIARMRAQSLYRE